MEEALDLSFDRLLMMMMMMMMMMMIQHATRMCLIIICGMLGAAIFFCIISLMVRFSKKKILLKSNYILTFSTTMSETFLILQVRRNERDVIENVY